MDMNKRVTAALAALLLASAASTLASSHAIAKAPARGVQVAALFGESDDEKAARLQREQHEADQDAAIAELKRRVRDLELSLQQATGQNELLSHRLQELNERIDQQRQDFAYKLCTLAAQQLGAGTSPDQSGTGLPCDTASAMATLTRPSGAAPALGSSGPGVPQGAPNPAAARAQYDDAMNLLAKARYDEARAAFRAFTDANAKDPLAPQALYWVGDIAFVQRDYSGAAQAFAEYLKKYPTSAQGADSMLKLGQSLLALDQKKEGCLTLGAIKTKYKTASASILSQAATARATAACK